MWYHLATQHVSDGMCCLNVPFPPFLPPSLPPSLKIAMSVSWADKKAAMTVPSGQSVSTWRATSPASVWTATGWSQGEAAGCVWVRLVTADSL